MKHEEIICHGTDHFLSFPVFKKKQELNEFGDVLEIFERASEQELREQRAACLFSDALNGTHLADTPHMDKFQMMDALEYAIDNMSDDMVEKLKGKLNDE